jgi:hypothetical protein
VQVKLLDTYPQHTDLKRELHALCALILKAAASWSGETTAWHAGEIAGNTPGLFLDFLPQDIRKPENDFPALRVNLHASWVQL